MSNLYDNIFDNVAGKEKAKIVLFVDQSGLSVDLWSPVVKIPNMVIIIKLTAKFHFFKVFLLTYMENDFQVSDLFKSDQLTYIVVELKKNKHQAITNTITTPKLASGKNKQIKLCLTIYDFKAKKSLKELLKDF